MNDRYDSKILCHIHVTKHPKGLMCHKKLKKKFLSCFKKIGFFSAHIWTPKYLAKKLGNCIDSQWFYDVNLNWVYTRHRYRYVIPFLFLFEYFCERLFIKRLPRRAMMLNHLGIIVDATIFFVDSAVVVFVVVIELQIRNTR